MIVQLDTANANLNIGTAWDTAIDMNPVHATQAMLVQAVLYVGDGADDFTANATIKLRYTLAGDQEGFTTDFDFDDADTRGVIVGPIISVPANTQLEVELNSSEAGDTVVDVTCIVYDVHPAIYSSGDVKATLDSETVALSATGLDLILLEDIAALPVNVHEMINFIYKFLAGNKVTLDGDNMKLYKDNGSTPIATMPVADAAGTQTRGAAT